MERFKAVKIYLFILMCICILPNILPVGVIYGKCLNLQMYLNSQKSLRLNCAIIHIKGTYPKEAKEICDLISNDWRSSIADLQMYRHYHYIQFSRIYNIKDMGAVNATTDFFYLSCFRLTENTNLKTINMDSNEEVTLTTSSKPVLAYITNTFMLHQDVQKNLQNYSMYTQPKAHICKIELNESTIVRISGLAGYFEILPPLYGESYIEFSQIQNKSNTYKFYQDFKKNVHLSYKSNKTETYILQYHSYNSFERAIFGIPIMVLNGSLCMKCWLNQNFPPTTMKPDTTSTAKRSTMSVPTTTISETSFQSPSKMISMFQQGEFIALAVVIFVLLVIIAVLIGMLLCMCRKVQLQNKENEIRQGGKRNSLNDYCEIDIKSDDKIPSPLPKKNIEYENNVASKNENGTDHIKFHANNLEARYSLEKTVKDETNEYCRLDTKVPEENGTAYSLEKSVPENRKSVIEMVSNDVYNDSYTPSETTPKSNDQDLNDATDDCRKSVVKMVSNDVYNDSDTASEVSCKSNNNNDAEDSEIATNFRKSDDEMVNNDVYNDDDTIILPQDSNIQGNTE